MKSTNATEHATTAKPTVDLLDTAVLGGLDFTAELVRTDPAGFRLTIETDLGSVAWEEYDAEGNPVRAGGDLSRIVAVPPARHMVCDGTENSREPESQRHADDQIAVAHGLHDDLLVLIEGFLLAGWVVRVSHLPEADEVRLAGVLVEAEPRPGADIRSLSRAFAAGVTGLRVLWDLQSVEFEGATVIEWAVDTNESGVETDNGLASLGYLGLLGIVTALAPEDELPEGARRPMARHSFDAPMPPSTLAAMLNRSAEPPSPAQLSERQQRIEDWARESGFDTTVTSPNPKRVTEALATLKSGSAGYYLLEFTDGQCYVGQSVSIDKRLGQHRQVHNDIASIRLLPDREAARFSDPLGDLLKRERQLIRGAQTYGLTPQMRNKAEMTIIPGNDQLLDRELLGPQARERWMRDPVAVNKRDLCGTSRFTPEQRRESDHEARCRAMVTRARQYGDVIVDSLSAYVRRCLPLPLSTEYGFWTVSTPRNGSRVVCLSIGMTEVLTYFIDKDQSFTAKFQVDFIELAGPEGEAGDQFVAFLRHHPGVELGPVEYRDAGPDNVFLYATSPAALEDLLDDTAVTRAAATAALNLMRVRPSMATGKRSHNLALAGLALGVSG